MGIKIEKTFTNKTIKGIGGNHQLCKGKISVGRKTATFNTENNKNHSKTNQQGEVMG